MFSSRRLTLLKGAEQTVAASVTLCSEDQLSGNYRFIQIVVLFDFGNKRLFHSPFAPIAVA